jgi:hypothetical protein
MMDMRMPETCWAVFKRQAINLRGWCIWLVDLFEYMRYCIFALGRRYNVLVVKCLLNMVVTVTYWANVARVGSLRARQSSDSRCSNFKWSSVRAVRIVQSVWRLGYGMHDPGFESRQVPKGSSAKRPDRLWGPPVLLFNGYLGYFSGVKRPWRDVDHCLPSSAEVKNEWSCTSTSVHAYLPCVVTFVPCKSVCGSVPLSFRIFFNLSAVVPFDVV